MSDGARRLCAAAALWSAAVLTAAPAPAAAAAIKVAVLGDSDSHSYRDLLNGVMRGGGHNPQTFNWLEIWARLRPGDIDPGPFVRAGDPRWAAGLKALAGRPSRTPKKDDYLYNYAWSGAGCASLNDAWPQQTRWLLARLKSDPESWREGLVVIRIGVNDFGQSRHLAQIAKDPARMDGAIAACLSQVATAVARIRAASDVRIALVGIAHDYETPLAGSGVVPDAALAGVADALARFDAGLGALAEKDARIAFADDRTWLTRRFGARSAGSARESAEIAGLAVRNAVGDGAAFLHTADGHAGTLASGLFLQDFIAALNARFGWTLSAPRDAEIVALATD
jgi:lysophospholipase L1-like esterase